jgi:hypothetical protein
MASRVTTTAIVAAIVVAIIAGHERPAVAANCDTLPPPIVYLQVGDTQLNLMKRLGRALRDNTAHPITLVFTTSGSCVNIDNFYHHTAAISAAMQYVPSTLEDGAWTPASPTLTCTPVPAVFPDIGNSALFNSACTSEAPPATVALTYGPKQAYVMAVPKASSQIAITFEEAYFVFGFGMVGAITPWIDETQLFIRTITKSTLLAWAANIAVDASKWKGVRFDGSPLVVAALQGSTAPEAALGILGAEVYDANRTTLTSLAFRARGQYAAYYADSTSSSRDKKNLRDGHYTVWSPTVWMDNVSGGVPTNADARAVVDLIAGRTASIPINFDPVAIVAAVGLVPDCAMRVSRTFEGGPLSLYMPSESCTCAYEAAVDTTTCQTCTTTCTTGVCRNGYCEEN